MEPKLDDTNKKGAPIVIWSNDSPTKNPSSPSSGVYQTPTGEIKSNGSSGIGKDSPERTTSESVTYSPALSSFGDDTKEIPIKNYSDYNYSSNNNIPIKNGDAKLPSYLSDGVKFMDPGCLSINKEDSICSSGSSDESEVKKPKVPDGGWGWVVVMSSLVISMIADGISFSFGLLYIEFLNHFGASKSKTAWIGSLFMAVPLLSGPIMSALVDRYGCKWMTIIGGTISAIGFILSCFADSIEYLLITFGVIAGIGLGLCYVTAVVSIAYWFDKYRTLATGLGACGTGVGTFVYAPMTQFFIDEYGWRGTVLLLAGTFLNMCVCGAVMRDPEWWIIEQNKQNSLAGTKSIRNASSCGSISGMDGESQFPGPEEIRNMLKSGQTPEYILTTLVMSINDTPTIEEKDENPPLPSSRSVVNLPTFVRQSEKVPLEVLQQLSSNPKIFNVILENYPSLLTCRSMSDNGKLNQIPPDVATKRIPLTMSMRLKAHKKKTSTTMAPTTILEHTSMENLETCATPLLPVEAMIPGVIMKATDKAIPTLPYPRRQMSVRDSGQHYLKHIRVHRNSVMYRGATLNLPRYHLRASSCPNIYRNSMTTIARDTEEKWYSDALEFCKGMFDFSMFLEFHFQLMSLATILLFVWFIVPYFYLAEHLTRNGYTEQEASHLISIIGVTNCLGMVGLGWAGDQPWMSVTKTYSVCLVLCGVMCILMPFLTYNYYLLGVVCALFGLFFASNYSFTPTILVELIPLERFTTAYGLILLCQGIGNLLGPPLAGWLFDVTDSWDLSFYMAGVWIILAGILVSIIPYTKNKKIWGSGMLEMDRISNA